MNLTKDEAAALENDNPRRRSGPRRRPAPTLRELPDGMSVVLTIGAVMLGSVLFAAGFHSRTSHDSQVVADITQSPATAQTEQQPAQLALPPGIENKRKEYLPAGWDYSFADLPIDLHDRQQRVTTTLPPRTEFLRSCQTTNGWAFVATLDGAAWGWAHLKPSAQRRIPMDPKFEKALMRTRGVQVIQKAEDPVYLPVGWVYEQVVGPLEIRRGDRIVAIVPAGTEFLRYWHPVNGLWFIVTLDGEMWGWARVIGPPDVRVRRHMEPRFEKALARLQTLQASRNAQVGVVNRSEAPGSEAIATQDN